jgi:hypothetical protein
MSAGKPAVRGCKGGVSKDSRAITVENDVS